MAADDVPWRAFGSSRTAKKRAAGRLVVSWAAVTAAGAAVITERSSWPAGPGDRLPGWQVWAAAGEGAATGDRAGKERRLWVGLRAHRLSPFWPGPEAGFVFPNDRIAQMFWVVKAKIAKCGDFNVGEGAEPTGFENLSGLVFFNPFRRNGGALSPGSPCSSHSACIARVSPQLPHSLLFPVGHCVVDLTGAYHAPGEAWPQASPGMLVTGWMTGMVYPITTTTAVSVTLSPSAKARVI